LAPPSTLSGETRLPNFSLSFASYNR
jgi:hypothetical protein